MKLKLRGYTIQQICLSLMSVGFMHMEPYLVLLVAAVGIMFSRKKTIHLSFDFVLLTVTFTCYYIIMSYYHTEYIGTYYYISRYWIGPVLAYLCGSMIACESDKKVLHVILIVLAGSLLHGILNLMNSQALSAVARSVKDCWTNRYVSATLQGTLISVPAALTMWCWKQKSKSVKIAGIFLALVCVWNALATASRTSIILMGLMIIATPIFYALLQGRGIRKKLYFLTKAVLIVSILILAAYICYQNNVLNIKTVFVNSNLGVRVERIGSMTESDRGKNIMDVIHQLAIHPMGNLDMFYAHNLWLDMGRCAGVIPMTLLILFTIAIVYRVYKIAFTQEISIDLRTLIVVVELSYLICFCLEPILEGVPFMFVDFCFINGAISTLSRKGKRIQRRILA